jgi:hypothetical protein
MRRVGAERHRAVISLVAVVAAITDAGRTACER